MKKMNQKNTDGTIIYIGPSYYGTIQTNTAIRGNLSSKVERLLEKKPYLNGLFVPAKGLAAARKELKTPGTEKNILYKRAEKEIGNV